METIKHCGNCKYCLSDCATCSICVEGDEWEMQDYTLIDIVRKE